MVKTTILVPQDGQETLLYYQVDRGFTDTLALKYAKEKAEHFLHQNPDKDFARVIIKTINNEEIFNLKITQKLFNSHGSTI